MHKCTASIQRTTNTENRTHGIMPTLLPSPIDGDEEYLKMKRAAIVAASSGRGSPNGIEPKETNARPAPAVKGPNRKAAREMFVAEISKYYAGKKAALGAPFDLAGPSKSPIPFRVDYDGKIKRTKAQKITKYEGSMNYRPLPNDAIVEILKAAKPHCEKAKAWIAAVEAQNKIRLSRKASEIEKGGLRKHLAEKLRVQSGMALREPDESKLIIENVLTSSPPAEDEDLSDCGAIDDDEEEEDEAMNERFKKVREASARLQEVIFDGEGAGSENFLKQFGETFGEQNRMKFTSRTYRHHALVSFDFRGQYDITKDS